MKRGNSKKGKNRNWERDKERKKEKGKHGGKWEKVKREMDRGEEKCE